MNRFLKVLLILVFLLVSNFNTSFAQTIWTKYQENPVFDFGAIGSWDELSAGMSTVLFDDSTYHMWYAGYDGSNFRIGHATSLDGINWIRDPLNPVLDIGQPGSWDGVYVGLPCVLKNGTTFHMWYDGYDGTKERIGHATSMDGSIWIKDTLNPVLDVGLPGSWEDSEVHPGAGSVIFDGVNYQMWYGGYNSSSGVFAIGHATSPDGIDWVKNPLNPVMINGGSMSWDDHGVLPGTIFYDGSKYKSWYNGHVGDYRWRVGYATSTDGINWVRENNPVLDYGVVGSWDNTMVWYDAVLFDSTENLYKMWYSGGALFAQRIGYATAPVTINVPADVATIQAAIDSASDGNLVLVADGTYLENINFKGKAITVASHFYLDGDTSHKSNTIIDGSSPSNADSGSVVYFISGEDTTSVLCGFTITGGTGTFQAAGTPPQPPFSIRSGGGILIGENLGAKIIDNIIEYNGITANEYSAGGGISTDIPGGTGYTIIEKNKIRYNDISGETTFISGGGIFMGGSGRIIKNDIIGNSVNSVNADVVAGGIRLLILSGSPATAFCRIEDNMIMQNMAVSINGNAHAAGLNSSGIEFLLRGNKILDNVVDAAVESWSAAMHIGGLSGVSSRIENNHFSGNSSLRGTCFGGALYITGPSLVLANNIFDNNSANYGGALYLHNSQITLENNTLVDNYASNTGGGVYADQSTFDIINSIMWGNTASANSQIYRLSGGETVTYSDIQGGWLGTGNIDTDPMFVDSLFHLSLGSPCIDAGNPDPAYNDPDGSRNDMGRYGGPAAPSGLYTNDKVNKLPKEIYLSQNYPNPFNPTTTIEFSIPKTEFVSLKIYNVLGQEVATLVSEKLTSGNYKYNWNAGHLASGVYYYNIEVGDFINSKKLILLK